MRLSSALRESNGLVLVRGLHGLTPEELVEVSRALGAVESNPGVNSRFLIPGWPEVQVGASSFLSQLNWMCIEPCSA